MFKLEKTAIDGVVVITPIIHIDKRGCFFESFNDEWFRKNVSDTTFIQDNESHSTKNVIRGLHYQKGSSVQAKLVRCVKGSVLDVAVDLRKDSPTFGRYVSVLLTGENKKQLFIPRGFAHGFKALSDEAVLQYKVDNKWDKDSEVSVFPFDAKLDIGWGNTNYVLSEKDMDGKFFADLKDDELF